MFCCMGIAGSSTWLGSWLCFLSKSCVSNASGIFSSSLLLSPVLAPAFKHGSVCCTWLFLPWSKSSYGLCSQCSLKAVPDVQGHSNLSLDLSMGPCLVSAHSWDISVAGRRALWNPCTMCICFGRKKVQLEVLLSGSFWVCPGHVCGEQPGVRNVQLRCAGMYFKTWALGSSNYWAPLLAENSLISDCLWLPVFMLVWAFPCSCFHVVGTISELRLKSAILPKIRKLSITANWNVCQTFPHSSQGIDSSKRFSLNCWCCWYGCDIFSSVLDCPTSFLCLYKPRSVHEESLGCKKKKKSLVPKAACWGKENQSEGDGVVDLRYMLHTTPVFQGGQVQGWCWLSGVQRASSSPSPVSAAGKGLQYLEGGLHQQVWWLEVLESFAMSLTCPDQGAGWVRKLFVWSVFVMWSLPPGVCAGALDGHFVSQMKSELSKVLNQLLNWCSPESIQTGGRRGRVVPCRCSQSSLGTHTQI